MTNRLNRVLKAQKSHSQNPIRKCVLWLKESFVISYKLVCIVSAMVVGCMSRSIGKWRVALCLQPMYRTDNRQQTHAHNTFRCEWHTTTIVEGELVTHEVQEMRLQKDMQLIVCLCLHILFECGANKTCSFYFIFPLKTFTNIMPSAIFLC